jgi:very-short-patch-repair endonuclease
MENDPGYHFYNSSLQPLANRLRREMTKAECCLWKYVLKAGKLRGYKFRRQRPVLNYIADFICFELMLIIEVDGITHHWEGALERDEQRQRDLETIGFTVLRFDDEDILKHINHGIGYLEDWVEERTKAK